jgi:signal transduction histidine kinase
MNLLFVFSIAALACDVALAYVTLRDNVRSRTHQIFVLYLLATAFGQLIALMVSLAQDTESALFWYRLWVIGAGGPCILYFFFTRAFLNRRTQPGVSLIAWLVLLVMLGLGMSNTNLVVEGVSRSEITSLYVPRFGPLVPVVGLSAYSLLGYGVHNLVQAYRRSRDIPQRNRIRYLLFGVGAVVAGTLSNFVPTFQAYPIDRAANLVNALIIAYAILRYQLLDITLVIRKGLMYSSLTALLAGVYLLTVFIFASVVRSYVYGSLIPAIIIAATVAVAFQPMRDRAQVLIDRLFFREKYDAQLMLRELSELATSILDINRLTSFLLDRLTSTMHIERAYIMLREKEDAQFHLVAQEGQAGLGDAVIFRKDHPVPRWMASHKRSLTRHDVDVHPQFKALWAQERDDLDRIEAELFVPLLVRDELVGLLILGPKFSETSYSQDEQLTLTTLANQTAVAIQNAWLYSDLEQSLKELKQMQAQLIQTEKLSAIGEMIAGVAHEINNPLTAVIGYSQLLQIQAMGLDSQVREDVGQILQAGLRMKRIVANLLDFSRQHSPQKEYVDINRIISNSLGLRVHDLMASRIRVQTNLTPGLPRTMADRHQLQQVFVNIINNAQQAMAEKGGPGVLNVSTEHGRDDTLLVRFQDTGPGIPQKIMGRIFDPFFTTKEVGKGTGLGLSVSYGILQEHEGRIWAESENGQGATFFVQLPVRNMAQPTHSESSPEPALAHDGTLQ